MKKALIFTLTSILLCGLLVFGAFAETVGQSSEQTTVTTAPQGSPVEPREGISSAISPAVEIIAANSGMAKSGIAGNDISFSEDDFARAMNLSKIESLKFVSVPSSADGVLLVGNTAIAAGQSITRANIGLLSFDPATDATGKTSFEVSINGAEYSVTCALYMLSSPNASPSVESVAQTLLELDGYCDTAIFGKLGAYDPEGDALTFQIVDAPDRGLLILTDRTAGKYTYLPENGFSGRDAFSYVVYDKYGNYSASARVSLTVSTPSTSVVYTDMVGNSASCAAINMTENGIMSGTQVGSLCYFYPDSQVSRVEFLVMAMNAAGIKDLPSSAETGFFDESSIEASAKPYVAAAKQLGYISGREDAEGNLCFAPDEKITRAEAALMVDRIINGKSYLDQNAVAPVFKDASEVPEWAQSAVGTLNALGILHDEAGHIKAGDKITKGQTAQMLTYMMQVVGK